MALIVIVEAIYSYRLTDFSSISDPGDQPKKTRKYMHKRCMNISFKRDLNLYRQIVAYYVRMHICDVSNAHLGIQRSVVDKASQI